MSSDSLLLVCDEIKQFLEEPDLGFVTVYWGDQALVPVSPAAAVEPMMWTRELTETGRQATIRFSIAILIYAAKLGNIEENRREASDLAERVKTKFDQTRTLNGLVIHGMINQIEAGFGMRGNAQFRIIRLMWEGFSKVVMPITTS